MALSADDRLEILELAARYNFAIDHWLPEEFADTFTDDGIFRGGSAVRAQGRAGLIAYAQQRAAQGRPLRHFTSNAIIDGDGNEARLRLYLVAYDISDGIGPPYVMGTYDDRVVKVNGKWKFAQRHVSFCAGKSLGPT